jgi:hypothetical protein
MCSKSTGELDGIGLMRTTFIFPYSNKGREGLSLFPLSLENKQIYGYHRPVLP